MTMREDKRFTTELNIRTGIFRNIPDADSDLIRKNLADNIFYQYMLSPNEKILLCLGLIKR
jgi:hypothetical protein